MFKYENLKSLNKKANFIEEGGLRTKNIYKSSDIKSPLFSIITVVKNSSKNIRQTIESVIKQADQNIEYIIVDGNSDDETLDIIKSYNEKIDYWCSIKDKGIYDAMNYGLQLSSGSIIGIINSGDLYTDNAINIINKYFLENENTSFVFGTVKRHYLGNNVIIKTGFDKKRIKYNFDAHTCHSSGFFIRSNLQKKIGLYNLKYKCSSDYDLFYKIFNDKTLEGTSTNKNELVGIVSSGGFSSKFGFWNHLIEETKIRIKNNQNYFLIVIIFINAVVKYYLKKLS